MISDGLIDETARLKASGLTAANLSMRAIGYAETLEYLDGALEKDEMIELIKKNTRNYAKRQITYFKHFPGAVFVNPEEAFSVISRAHEAI